MTIEEIERILQTVAENQAKHDEMHSRHSADVAEIDAGIASLLRSQNRYEERQARLSEILHDLADKQLKNEERFAETDKRFAQLAGAQMRYEARQETLEASYQLLEQFVRDFRNETNGRFERTDERLDRMSERVESHDQRFARIEALQTANAEQIKALITAQARTDEQIRTLLDRNGSTAKPKARKATKKATKKGSAK